MYLSVIPHEHTHVQAGQTSSKKARKTPGRKSKSVVSDDEGSESLVIEEAEVGEDVVLDSLPSGSGGGVPTRRTTRSSRRAKSNRVIIEDSEESDDDGEDDDDSGDDDYEDEGGDGSEDGED